MDEESKAKETTAITNLSARLRGAWKTANPVDKQEIKDYFDGVRTEWERDVVS